MPRSPVAARPRDLRRRPQVRSACPRGDVVWLLAQDWASGAAWLQAVDLADPAHPRLRGRLDLTPEEAGGYGWGGIWGYGDQALLVGHVLALHRAWWAIVRGSGVPGCTGCGDAGDLVHLFDLSDPDRPARAASVVIPGSAWSWGLAAAGPFLWLTHYEWEAQPAAVRYYLDRIDVSDPYRPALLPKVNVPGVFFDASADGARLWTQEPVPPPDWNGDATTWVHALELTDRGTAKLLASASLAGWPGGSATRGGNAWIQTWAWGGGTSAARLAALRLDPLAVASVQEIGSQWAWIPKATGGKLFVAAGWMDQGIPIYGLGDPDLPSFERFVRTQRWVQDVVGGGGIAGAEPPFGSGLPAPGSRPSYERNSVRAPGAIIHREQLIGRRCESRAAGAVRGHVWSWRREKAMVLRQYYLGCLAQASYLVGDEQSGRAVVVDPRRDVDEYLGEAERLGLSIEEVILTHIHADFVSGHLELRDRAGCRIRLGARAKVEYPFTGAREGDTVELGSVRLRILETPGHTPESISIAVFDLGRDPARPHAILTGDALFVGDVGRPDLLASCGATADGMARELYRSLTGKLLTLPDETLVYPGHGGGSMCGRNLGSENVSTIGRQRRENYALQPMSEDEFASLVTADQPEAPPYFAHDAALNRAERPTLAEVMERELRPLGVDQLVTLRDAGAQVLDSREPPAFAAAHLSGSVNIGLSGKFATWAGTLLERDRPIVVVADPGREAETDLRLSRIGFDQVAGHLGGGVIALRERPELVAYTLRLSTDELAARLGSPRPPVVVDVRTPAERRVAAIAGSAHLPLQQLKRRTGELPRDVDMVMVCASGFRSCIAASLLQSQGFGSVADLEGGMAAWVSRARP
ncbi:MAG TPA: MBL fold metallo-hydrolase [Anaeromyxobacteraceae bacterium]|nr:MBL fold metallo-hydrolase [Anaeromyxobacteraceae bacterium]